MNQRPEISVKLSNISKSFPGGVLANSNISIDCKGGEVHAVLGENGAGKSTLMNILSGLYKPDTGEIEINGKSVVFRTTADAKRAGIGMVHQHFSLVPALTVAENLWLSWQDQPVLLNQKMWSQHLSANADKLGFDINFDAPVWKLSLGERQRVEIFRLVMAGAEILILDEPTSILAPKEAELLFKHIRSFVETGCAILLITHKIHHVRAIADRVTILRQGKVVADCDADDLNNRELAEAMVGKSFAKDFDKRQTRKSAPGENTVLQIRNLSVSSGSNPSGVENLDLDLHSGEILGIAGVSGNGQDELAAAIFGMIDYEGQIVQLGNGSQSGGGDNLAYIPGDRRGVGTAPSLSIQDNLVLREFRRWPFSKCSIIRDKAVSKFAEEKINKFEIRPPDPAARSGNLSGGNLQKIVVARELNLDPNVIIAANPTTGLDVATLKRVHDEFLERVCRGTGLLMISEDLDELLLLCDRIAVIYKGKIVNTFAVGDVAKGEISLAMSGVAR